MIKFRAWDKFDEEMLEVHGINFDAQGIWTREMIDDESDSNFVFLDEVELLQSTGLFDLDGNEIYIGDILKIEYEYTQVVFHEDNTTYGIYLEDKEGGGNPISDYSTRISLNHINGNIEGNIYQHPHLLEE